MNIDFKKVNIFEFASEVDGYGIPIVKQEILPLTSLSDTSFWKSLNTYHSIDIAKLDYHHWRYDDKTFNEYVHKISSIKFPALALFDAPYGYEFPNVELASFSKKLIERTQILAESIRASNPDCLLISPAIGLVHPEREDDYLDFFVVARKFFDVYSLHLCNDMSDHSLGRLISFCNQVMQILPKPIWITKWAIPSFEGTVRQGRFLGDSWVPMNYSTASQKLMHSFASVEKAAIKGSVWFYTGLGKDRYSPRISKFPGPHEYWQSLPKQFVPDTYERSWDFCHFLGMLTHDGKIKQPLIDSFLQLVVQQNV